MNDRMRDALEREQLRDLIVRYNTSGDAHRIEPMMAVWTDDALYESAIFRLEGVDAIRQYFGRAWTIGHGTAGDAPRAQPRFRQHHTTTAQFDLTGPDSASGLIYYLVVSELGPDHCGTYQDRYRRTADGWKIAARAVTMEWCRDDSPFVPASSRELLRQGIRGPAGT